MKMTFQNFSTFNQRYYDIFLQGYSRSTAIVAAYLMQKRTDSVGFAIVCVLLSEYDEVRNVFDSEDNHGLTSLTSSGKIRLVRERMGIPKPLRR